MIPFHLYLIENMEDTVVYLTRKVFISQKCTSHFTEKPKMKMKNSKKQRHGSNSYLIRQSFNRNCCKSDFAWNVPRDYVTLHLKISMPDPNLFCLSNYDVDFLVFVLKNYHFNFGSLY